VRVPRSLALAMALLAGLAAGSAAVSSSASETKPADKKTQTRSKTAPKPAPQTAPTSAPENQPVQTKGGVTVRENYFMHLPGIDLSTLTPKQKDRFLERVNKESCTCGCQNDTIARCLVNDPKCGTVRGLAEKVLSEVKAGR
jgi:hypothetical protein